MKKSLLVMFSALMLIFASCSNRPATGSIQFNLSDLLQIEKNEGNVQGSELPEQYDIRIIVTGDIQQELEFSLSPEMLKSYLFKLEDLDSGTRLKIQIIVSVDGIKYFDAVTNEIVITGGENTRTLDLERLCGDIVIDFTDLEVEDLGPDERCAVRVDVSGDEQDTLLFGFANLDELKESRCTVSTIHTGSFVSVKLSVCKYNSTGEQIIDLYSCESERFRVTDGENRFDYNLERIEQAFDSSFEVLNPVIISDNYNQTPYDDNGILSLTVKNKVNSQEGTTDQYESLPSGSSVKWYINGVELENTGFTLKINVFTEKNVFAGENCITCEITNGEQICSLPFIFNVD